MTQTHHRDIALATDPAATIDASGDANPQAVPLYPPNGAVKSLSYDPGSVIFRESDHGDCAYLILSGEVEIEIERVGRKLVLGRRCAGEIVGEMAIIDDRPRSATARATRPSELVAISRHQLAARIESTDPVTRMCLNVILERFRSTLARLRFLEQEDSLPVARQPVVEPDHQRGDGRDAIQEILLENDLRRSLQQDDFQAHYQPIVDLETGGLSGFEALLRWRHPERGLLYPVVIIPTAEASGLIVPLDRLVLAQACAAIKKFSAAVCADTVLADRLNVHVNISARDFHDPGFVDAVAGVLADTAIDPGRLILEVTESVFIESPDLASRKLKACRDLGVGLALDDFGTGFSSLSYLHRLPIDIVKIDRSFVGLIEENLECAEIVSSILHLAEKLKITAIAEGIETSAQRKILLQMGCRVGQGFLFGRPRDHATTHALLRSWQPDLGTEPGRAVPA